MVVTFVVFWVEGLGGSRHEKHKELFVYTGVSTLELDHEICRGGLGLKTSVVK